MRFIAPSPAAVSTSSERDAKRQSFFADGVARQIAAGNAPVQVTIVARSLASPIVSAAARVLAPVAGSLAVRAIVMDASESCPAELDCLAADLRVLKDSRFGAAHEQIVVGDSHVWIGDCMRRDPTKRDAFEMMHEGEAAAASHAARSFERLWAVAQPAKALADVAPGLLAAGMADYADLAGQRR